MSAMPIHTAFKATNRTKAMAARNHAGVVLVPARDTMRQKCYAWEFKHLRPGTATLSRQDAKGLARLAAKKATRLMRDQGLIRDDADMLAIMASFSAAFSREKAAHSWGGEGGVYFAEWGWTKPIILHEVAHWADHWAHLFRARNAGGVSFGYIKASLEGHGPRWRGWFLWLLANVEWSGHRYNLATLAPMPGRVTMPTA